MASMNTVRVPSSWPTPSTKADYRLRRKCIGTAGRKMNRSLTVSIPASSTRTAGEFGEKYAFLDNKVQNGMGIMFMHYGVHPTKEVGEAYYKKWIGGYYDDAFSVNPSWVADLTPKAGHPIARGLDAPFKTFDELYWNLNFDSKDPNVLSPSHCHSNQAEHGTLRSSKFWNILSVRIKPTS